MVVFFHILVLVLLLLSSSFSSLFSQKAKAVLNYLKSTKCRLISVAMCGPGVNIGSRIVVSHCTATKHSRDTNKRLFIHNYS